MTRFKGGVWHWLVGGKACKAWELVATTSDQIQQSDIWYQPRCRLIDRTVWIFILRWNLNCCKSLPAQWYQSQHHVSLSAVLCVVVAPSTFTPLKADPAERLGTKNSAMEVKDDDLDRWWERGIVAKMDLLVLSNTSILILNRYE